MARFYCMQMVKFICISLLLCFCCCVSIGQYGEMKKKIEPTPNKEKVVVLKRVVKSESIEEFKQRVHKKGEWMAKHGQIVYKIRYKRRKIFFETYYYADAYLYWRKDDSQGTI